MAEASISVDQDQFSCPVCLDLLKDPVTIHCGHSFCMVCINGCWDQEDQRGVYSCPQCRETFTLRPVLRRNNMLAEVLEKVKKTELQAAPPAHCYAGPGDVECDFCTGRKRKAIKSCLVCVASLCETHLKPHLEIPALIKHKLVKASTRLQEKICSQHDEVVKIYCRTDQSCICYLCTMHEHKGHDTVAAAAERTKKQSELKKIQRKSQQRLQQKEKKLQELKQAVVTLKRSAQAAVEDSERIFTQLICSIEKKRSEVTELIRTQEKNQLRQTEELLENLQQEIDDLKRRNTELEQLSVTEDHIHFLQSFQSLSVSSGCEDSSSITVHQHPSFDGVRKSLSDLKERLEEFCKEEFSKISPHAAALQTILSSEPKTREDFLQYFCRLTLDPNTVNRYLDLSQNNRVVKYRRGEQRYSDHPERFDSCWQVLCKESVSGRCYWEVEWDNDVMGVSISVSYKGISRKVPGNMCKFGHNNQSWKLQCSNTLSFWHNNIKTELSAPSSSRIGVYVDHSAGTLSFYSVSDTMTLLHTVHTTFTQPLYAGFHIGGCCGVGGTVRLCDQNEHIMHMQYNLH
ncbi:tripartite motif-containing protein 16-like isoform X2 [Colossoma macropomum]|uniref:tripartite motif-containing protein 16-like isoform X2 n=1 Tax=Colossoma macropomum TaxID=42526 RepID=UPI001864928B|nr:tripartite motif-containing protein 16-like isoform X2 [Colossoma macropomum]